MAKSLLHMISNDIGQLACLYARLHHLDRVYFGGFFIRGHPVTMRTITYSINFFSKVTGCTPALSTCRPEGRQPGRPPPGPLATCRCPALGRVAVSEVGPFTHGERSGTHLPLSELQTNWLTSALPRSARGQAHEGLRTGAMGRDHFVGEGVCPPSSPNDRLFGSVFECAGLSSHWGPLRDPPGRWGAACVKLLQSWVDAAVGTVGPLQLGLCHHRGKSRRCS